jgi:hypothetical protein
MNVYGEQGYNDAADREDRRLDDKARRRAEGLEYDMMMMAADRESNLSPLDAEYPPEQCQCCGDPMKHGGNDGHQCS